MAEAKVANGLSVRLTGIATVQLQIADITRDIRLCFTSQDVLGKDVPFDIIRYFCFEAMFYNGIRL
jgi:hypothetical protein